MLETFTARYYYLLVIFLMMLGLWGMISKRNLMKKLIAMTIFQSAIIFFYIASGVKRGAAIPIIEHDHTKINPDLYHNPLPHVLMLTAIVVGVATLGVALALLERIYDRCGSIEEDEIIRKLEE
ncbi:MAG: NADH-quinone oxidoreductase subunit J [Candidatus Dadabacteria bacterium]|nr:MAG: NADH-quinone oxidoreductase subunit J [Candidatus Dadabacteria bacterium]